MKIFLVIVVVTASLFSCEDDDYSIKPITEDNSFSCFINGELFLPKDRLGFPSHSYGIEAEVIPETNDWFLDFSNHDIHRHVTLLLKNVVSTGEYQVFARDSTLGVIPFEKTQAQYYDTTLNNLFVSNDITGVVNVTEFTLNSKIILTFDTLTLEELSLDGTSNSMEPLILSNGQLNINLETLD